MTVYGTGLGLYPYGETGTAENDEVSSTYEGRHLTVLGTQITSEMAGHALQQKGHPLVVGENIVGVAFNTEVAGGYVTFDTEGIWLLSVVATDEAGENAVVAGDELFIHKTNGIISKNNNKNTHAHFGYALGGVEANHTAIISVKVHWDPDDAEELVGTHAAPLTNAEDSKIFREYRYRSTSVVGDIRGQYMELLLAGVGASGEAGRNRTMIEAAVAVAHGCHDGVEFDTGGSVTGLAVGHRATYKAKNAAAAATIAGGMSELWADGAATNFATATVHSIHRFVVDGDAGGRATAQNVWEFANLPTGAGTGYMLDTGQNATASTDGLRCIINGAVYMVLVASV